MAKKNTVKKQFVVFVAFVQPVLVEAFDEDSACESAESGEGEDIGKPIIDDATSSEEWRVEVATKDLLDELKDQPE